jgi:hypothetical protein
VAELFAYLTSDGVLKEGGYFALLIAVLWLMWRAGKAVGYHLFHEDKGIVRQIANKGVETLHQVKVSVQEQSEASKQHARSARLASQSQRRTNKDIKQVLKKIEVVETRLLECQAKHPPDAISKISEGGEKNHG